MSEDRAGANDEPLDGDIGPASGASEAGTTGSCAMGSGTMGSNTTGSDTTGSGAPEADAAEELRRYEAEREERRRRTNAVSGRIAVVAAAVLLAFLTYDSVRTAVAAHSKGDEWIYPPAVIAGVCAIALSTLLIWAARRVK